MSIALKAKHVLLFAEFGELGHRYIRTLFDNNVKSLTVCNIDVEGYNKIKDNFSGKNFAHIYGDANNIKDLEVVFEETLKRHKKIDVVINSKETNNSNWETTITHQLNSLIRCSLMAMKHLGTMNSGKGGIVVNAVTVHGVDGSQAFEGEEAYPGIRRLLNDLDRSFGNPYYYGSTAVQILTMCTNIETVAQESESEGYVPAGATTNSASSSRRIRYEDATDALLDLLNGKKNELRETTETGIELTQISIS